MSDDGKELAKMAMEVALRPVTEVAEDVIGIFGGDWLSEKRRVTRERLKAKANEELRRQGIKDPVDPSPSVLIPLLRHAQDESREGLLGLWAKLLAAAANPQRSGGVRKDFIELASQLEPMDALVLERFRAGAIASAQRHLAGVFGVGEDEIAVALEHLREIGCLDIGGSGGAALSVKGRELMRVLYG